MDERELVNGFDLTPAFIAGVSSVAYDRGMSEKDAECFVKGICKSASRRLNDYYDEEDDTFWNRNKKWLIPTIVGGIAYWVGADGNRADNPGFRADSWSITNSARVMGERLKRLLGMNDNALEKALKKTE